MMTRICTIRLGLAIATMAFAPAMAQVSPGPVKLTVHPLRGSAYWVSGGRSNSGFIVGKTGVILIDAQMDRESVDQENALIATVTRKPIDQVVVTHGDPDHVAGAMFYGDSAVIMHENTHAKVIVSAVDPKAPPMYAPIFKTLASHLPSHTIGTTTELTLDGVRMVVMYPGPAHTSGDLVVYLPAQKIVFGGDLLVNNSRLPIIHLGGSTIGWLQGMKTILALDANTYIPGHGEILNKAQLRARVLEVEELREKIKALVYEGKTLAEVQQALPEKVDNPRFLSFTEVVFGELTHGNPAATPPWNDIIHR